MYAQTRVPDEVIVVDDGSTDDTAAFLRELPVRVVRQPNGGEASARNRGVSEARGDLVAFLDHDDLWEPRKLERQVGHIGWADLSFTDCIERRTPGLVEFHRIPEWQPNQALDRLSRGAGILTPSAVLARREVLMARPFEHVEPFGTDWLLYLRLAEAGCRIEHLAEPLTIRRLHGANMSGDYERWLQSGDAVFERFGNHRCSASWHLQVALLSRQRGEARRARRHIFAAARAHPQSVRPGWVRLVV